MGEVREETFEQRLRRKGYGWVGPVWHLVAHTFGTARDEVQVTLRGTTVAVSVDGMERLVVHDASSVRIVHE